MTQNTTPPICKTCAWSSRWWFEPWGLAVCRRPADPAGLADVESTEFLVTGRRPDQRFCEVERRWDLPSTCGPKGRYWTATLQHGREVQHD